MAGNDLTVKLSLDGKPFQDKFVGVMRDTSRSISGVGRQMGQRFTSAFMSIFGYVSITRLASQLMQWGSNADDMKKKFADMGIAIEDGMVKQLQTAGRELHRMNLQLQKDTLPLLVGMSQFMLAVVEQWGRAKAFYSGMAKEEQPKFKFKMGYIWQPWRALFDIDWGKAADAGALSRDAFDRDLIKGLTQDLENLKLVGLGADDGGTASKFTLRGGGKGGSRLASIGGDVGGLNDRVMRIEIEQVRILKQIASNTKAKSPSIGLEIPAS